MQFPQSTKTVLRPGDYGALSTGVSHNLQVRVDPYLCIRIGHAGAGIHRHSIKHINGIRIYPT